VRVLHVLWYSKFGGVENYTRDLFTELERRGHENVIVLAGEMLDGVEVAGRTVHPLPAVIDPSPALNSTLRAELGRILDAERVDVAYLHTSMNQGASDLLLARVPSVYFAHNYTAFCPSGALYYERTHAICSFETAPNWGCLVNAYLQRCNTGRPGPLLATYRRAQQMQKWTSAADAIVCDSEYVKARHVMAGFAGDRIHVLPSPVRIPKQPSPPPAKRDTVAFIGRLVKGKGVETLVEAMSSVPAPARLVIAGEGPLRPVLESRARALGVSDRIDFAGRLSVAQVSVLYERAAVVAVPSEWPEPLGMVGPEALGHGRPVAGTAAGGSAEWLKDGETGLATPPKNAKALAAALNRLLADPALSTQLALGGRRLVEERFSVETHVNNLIPVFEGAVARRQVSAGRG
jgi:glycosyltransferase involved in cell wall biosynthesis